MISDSYQILFPGIVCFVLIYTCLHLHIFLCVCVYMCVYIYENNVVEGILSSELKYLILNLESSVQVNFRFNSGKVLSFEALGHFLLLFFRSVLGWQQIESELQRFPTYLVSITVRSLPLYQCSSPLEGTFYTSRMILHQHTLTTKHPWLTQWSLLVLSLLRVWICVYHSVFTALEIFCSSTYSFITFI